MSKITILESRVSFWVILMLSMTAFLNGFSQYPKSPEPWYDAYNISIEGFEFQHPMTVLNADEIAIIKERLKYGVEPQKTAYNELISEAQVALDFVPDPPSNLNIPGGYVDSDGLENARTILWNNCHSAYTCALAHTFTNDNKYADKAISILMSWADKGTTFTDDDRGLQLGSYFTPMLYAADLLYNYAGWEATDKEKFKTWWNQECVINGDVLDVMRRKDNNWKDAGLLGIFAASVVLEDSSYLRESLIQLKSYFYPRNDEYVRLPGNSWKIANDQDGIYLPREVVRNDGSSGLTYTAYALTTMVQCFEIARYAGQNFWMDTTVHGAGILDVVNQYYRWDVRDEVFPWDSDANSSDKRRNLYELANTRFDLGDDMQDFIRINRPVKGREGDAYSTFNKGDMNGWDITSMAIPQINQVESLSSTKLKLEWTVLKNNFYGVIIEQQDEDGSFIVIDTLDRNMTSYVDTGLQAGTNFTYRIGVFNALDTTIYSTEITAATQNAPTQVPLEPDNLIATTINADQIALEWQDNSDNEESFIIERKSSNGFSVIGETGVNEITFLDKDLDFNTIYSYRVYAKNTFGNSLYSNEAVDTTLLVQGIFKESNGVVSMEAEHGNLSTRWQIHKDNILASGNKYIEVRPEHHETGDFPSCNEPTCFGVYYFDITNPGNYMFWFRILSTGGENDSFYWRIDGGDWVKENGRASIGNWFNSNNTEIDNLSEGIHIFEIANREDGTQLDKFIFQLDENAPPVEEGVVESVAEGEWLPFYPTGLIVMSNEVDTISLTWKDNSNNEQGFVIERMMNEDFEKTGEVAANVNSFIDTNVIPNNFYNYRVYSFNDQGKSIFSNIVNVLSKSISRVEIINEDIYKINLVPNTVLKCLDISYYVPYQEEVDISIYNIFGSKIINLKSEVEEKGEQNVRWVFSRDQNKTNIHGMYLCLFTFGSKIIIRKVVL